MQTNFFFFFFFFLKEIRNAEIAQRTKETAPSMHLDNIAPLEYFLHLVTDFEQRMQFYKWVVIQIITTVSFLLIHQLCPLL